MNLDLKVWSLGFMGFLTVACSSDANFNSNENQANRVKKRSDTETMATKALQPESASSAKAMAVDQAEAADSKDVQFDDSGPTQSEREFSINPLRDAEFSFDFRHKWLEQTIKLQNGYNDYAEAFHQIDRLSYSKAYKQGSNGQAKTEEFTQLGMGILDLVVVIDNSGSMKAEQENLSNKLVPLLESVKNSDWKINVVTTDPVDGCTRGGVISKNDANASSAFRAAVTAGTGGSGNERGILQAVNALKCNQIMGFPRTKSSIAVLIVADEDNCSANGNGCPGTAWNTPTYLTNFLKDNLGRALGSEARVYGIFWHPETICLTGENKATQYAQAVATTNGVYGSICSTDYTATLNRISEDMATILKSQFNLTSTPDPGSIVVKINDVETPTGWNLVGQTLTFTNIPPASAKIKVSYTTGSTPIKTRFALGQVPALATLSVKINGVVANASTYSLDAATGELVFAAPPPESAEIAINFRANTPLLTEFDLANKMEPVSIAVKINGTATSDFMVNSNGKLKFTQPPPDTAKIDVTYKAFAAKILDYSVALTGQSFDDLTVFDKTTGDSIVATYMNGKLTIDAPEHQEGREVVIRYKNESSTLTTFELKHHPEPDSIKLHNAPEACQDSIKVEEKKITFMCDDDAEKMIQLTYRYREKSTPTFDIDGVTNPDVGVWEVLVDGVATVAYTRIGSSITLTEMPTKEAKLKIIWKQE